MIYFTEFIIHCFLQLLVATMLQLRMEQSIHRSILTNTQTPKIVAGSSLFPMDMEFISTLLYCRQSLSLIT